ncbi:hypothetical protein HYT45_00865 [Candidatus Uhrbacteria bacterium]|nr:hypothetical protein [Candidatus Uhrbacteria bacterium]
MKPPLIIGLVVAVAVVGFLVWGLGGKKGEAPPAPTPDSSAPATETTMTKTTNGENQSLEFVLSASKTQIKVDSVSGVPGETTLTLTIRNPNIPTGRFTPLVTRNVRLSATGGPEGGEPELNEKSSGPSFKKSVLNAQNMNTSIVPGESESYEVILRVGSPGTYKITAEHIGGEATDLKGKTYKVGGEKSNTVTVTAVEVK